MNRKTIAILSLVLSAGCTAAQVNAGAQKSDTNLPFTVTQVTTLSLPWKIAFLPDGRMLITEKVGALQLVTPQGEKIAVGNVPAVEWKGQSGFLGVYLSPFYDKDHSLYLTYSEPGDGGSSLALARAELKIGKDTASLEGLHVIWRDGARGKGGQVGGVVTFSPDKKYLYLTVGDRQRMTPAQDPNSPLGKILRLTLDGKPAAGNPMAGKTGAASIPVINPPSDTERAKAAPVVGTYTFPGPNLTPSETWAMGFRTPYGLAFAPDGRLWELEHGPRGGDELNLIEPGKNYGWPLVSYGVNYNGVPIPTPDTRPDLVQPVIYWNPVIAPGSLTFYQGKMFPQWNGSAFATGLASEAILRIVFDGKGGARVAERWAMGHRMRDLEVAPDGSMWALEDAKPGGLFHLTPLGMKVLAPAVSDIHAAPMAATDGSVKATIANNSCQSCHHIGPDGGEVGPSLNGVGKRLTEAQLREVILHPPAMRADGKTPNSMPSYKGKISEADLGALVHYLVSLPPLP